METVAYYLALMTVVALPPGLLFWFLIHPFARWWRRIGPVPTYLIVGAVLVSIGIFLFRIREPLLRVRFGVSPLLVALAALAFLVQAYLGFERFRRLRTSTQLGWPELVKDGSTKTLVTQGIYSRVRHPRYLEIGFGLLGIALFTNYFAVYVLFGLSIPVLYLIVIIEERELRARFGEPYEEYCLRVPRFIPRFRPRNSD